MKLLKKIFCSLLIIIAINVSAIVIVAVLYKEDIIILLKEEVNKKIKTKLEVDKIDVKLIKGFPNISVDFQGVKFYSSFKDQILLESKNVYFVLNIFELLKKNIVVERLEIVEAKINITINKKGDKNYDVFSNNDSLNTAIESLNLKSILLKEVEINNVDKIKNIKDGYKIESLLGSLRLNDETVNVKVESQLRLVRTNLAQFKWLVGKHIKLNTHNLIDGDKILILPSTLAIQEVKLGIKGEVGFGKDRNVDLTIESDDLRYKNVVSILPRKLQKSFKPYKGTGLISFKSSIIGNFSGKHWPSLKAQLVCKDFEIQHDAILSPLKNINLVGTIKIKNLGNINSGVFHIKNLSASIAEKDIKIAMDWRNFSQPQFKGSVKGVIDIPWLLSFIHLDELPMENSNGDIEVDMLGEVNLSRDYKVIKNNLEGTVKFKNVRVESLKGLSLNRLNGNISFNDESLEVKGLNLYYGQSDFAINGVVHLPENRSKRLYSELKVGSDFVNLTEIFGVLTKSSNTLTSANQRVNLKYSVKLNLDLNSLEFFKFKGRNLDVNLSFNENKLNVTSAFASAMGGNLELKGNLSQQFNGDYYLKITSKTAHVNLDSLFYVFGNFKQTFITSEAIKGELDADVYAHMYFDEDWKFKQELLYSDALLNVKDGELIDFEPVVSLSEYLNEEGENLAKLKFSEIENHIIVSEDTVFISEMYVGTNVRNIKIGGYHTLSQHIDYRLAVPVINDKKDADTKFGKVKTDKKGHIYFPFRVYGTTSDYKVVYDFKTASSNFVRGVKKEIKGIRNVFVGKKNQEIVKDTLQIDDEEYFDWDNN